MTKMRKENKTAWMRPFYQVSFLHLIRNRLMMASSTTGKLFRATEITGKGNTMNAVSKIPHT
jgi:hypothetical protein